MYTKGPTCVLCVANRAPPVARRRKANSDLLVTMLAGDATDEQIEEVEAEAQEAARHRRDAPEPRLGDRFWEDAPEAEATDDEAEDQCRTAAAAPADDFDDDSDDESLGAMRANARRRLDEATFTTGSKVDVVGPGGTCGTRGVVVHEGHKGVGVRFKVSGGYGAVVVVDPAAVRVVAFGLAPHQAVLTHLRDALFQVGRVGGAQAGAPIFCVAVGDAYNNERRAELKLKLSRVYLDDNDQWTLWGGPCYVNKEYTVSRMTEAYRVDRDTHEIDDVSVAERYYGDDEAEAAAPAKKKAAPRSDGFDSMISPMTSAERAHFATLSKTDQEMARVMVRLRYRSSRFPNISNTHENRGIYVTFDRLAGLEDIDTSNRGRPRDRAKMSASPLVESFLASQDFAPAASAVVPVPPTLASQGAAPAASAAERALAALARWPPAAHKAKATQASRPAAPSYAVGATVTIATEVTCDDAAHLVIGAGERGVVDQIYETARGPVVGVRLRGGDVVHIEQTVVVASGTGTGAADVALQQLDVIIAVKTAHELSVLGSRCGGSSTRASPPSVRFTWKRPTAHASTPPSASRPLEEIYIGGGRGRKRHSGNWVPAKRTRLFGDATNTAPRSASKRAWLPCAV